MAVHFTSTSNIALSFLCLVFQSSLTATGQRERDQADVCPYLTAPPYGRFISQCNNQVGSSCSVECHQGYELLGSKSRTCEQSGLWSGTVFMCIDRSRKCGEKIIPPENGRIVGECENLVGYTCHLECDREFYLVGKQYITCTSKEFSWISPTPVCRAYGSNPAPGLTTSPPEELLSIKTCPELKIQSDEGMVEGSCPESNLHAKCIFTCKPTYHTTTGGSQATLTCIETGQHKFGQWSGVVPSCSPTTCPTIEPTKSSTLIGNCSYPRVGSRCTVSCSSKSPVELTCLDQEGLRYGKWNTEIPLCSDNAVKETKQALYKGPPSSRAVANYENELPVFKLAQQSGKLCPQLSLDSAQSGVQGSCGASSPIGTRCMFACRQNFLGSNSTLICQDIGGPEGQWMGTVPNCRAITCPNTIVNPANGAVFGNCTNANIGSTCSLTCNAGYRSTGPATIVCNNIAGNGIWSGTLGICQPNQCPSLFPPANGATTGSCAQAVQGQQCTFTCFAGYSLRGNQVLTCQQDTTWSSAAPTCQAVSCPTQNNPTNGQASCTGSLAGGTCNFQCNAGYRLVGVASITCQNDGTWSSAAPQCVQVTCGDLVAPSQGSLSGTCRSATPGSRCTFTCSPGFRLVGFPYATCLPNGTWDAITPQCQPIVCPTIPLPSGARADSGICTNARPGDVCFVNCLPGFVRTGDPNFLCQADGTWSANNFQCLTVQCPALSAPAGGSVQGTCSNASPGAECSFFCGQGYRLLGSPRAICQASGVWTSNTPACQRIMCRDLSAPWQGSAGSGCQNAVPGVQCTFQCGQGYVLVGRFQLVCGQDGNWDGVTPVCSRVLCETLKAPEGGTISGVCVNGSPGDICSFGCQYGFVRVGAESATCQNNGTWSALTPRCERIFCRNLSPPSGGSLSGSCQNAVPGSQCNFTCSPGFRLIGVNRLTCQIQGAWTGSEPVCQAILCENLVGPQGGSLSGSCTAAPPGSTCSFTCSPGYRLSGSPVLTCGTDGTWSTATPTCIPVMCPSLAAPAGGTSSGSCTNAFPGAVCTFACGPGFRLVGSTSSTCGINGSWSSSSPICQGITCPDISAPPNGGASGVCTTATFGATCSFTCNAGYRLSGVSQIICQRDGFWTANPPTCEVITCPDLVAPANGGQSGRCNGAPTPGSSCSFTCNQPYVIEGTPTLTCSNLGSWSSTTPICKRTMCPNLVPPVNSDLSGRCSGAGPGDVCQFVCQAGFRPTGPTSAICQQNGVWTNQGPTCLRISCPDLAGPAGGSTSGQCVGAVPGAQCSFFCPAGTRLVGIQQAICQSDGTWTGSTPTCQAVSCPGLSAPANGASQGSCSSALPGQSCNFSCSAGYALSGNPSPLCQPDGTWSSATPTCYRVSCPSLSAPSNGVLQGSCISASPGQTCTIFCLDGYRLVGSSVFTCQNNGVWFGTTPTCERVSCPSLMAPSGGSNTGACQNAVSGSQCNFTCGANYQLTGVPVLTCQNNGQWSSSVPICRLNVCPPLAPPANGQTAAPCGVSPPGSTCQFLCNPGYRRSGPTQRTCLPDATWSDVMPICNRVLCPTLAPLTNGQQSGICSSAGVSDSCLFTCGAGFRLLGNANATCLPDGTWSNAAPTCQAVTCPNLSKPANGELSGTCTSATAGSQCTARCLPNFTPSTSVQIVCQSDGTWQGVLPSCTAILCPTLTLAAPLTSSGSCTSAAPGAICQFACPSGYTLTGSTSLTCQVDGTWSAAAPRCDVVRCPDLGPTIGGTMSGACKSAVVGSQCDYNCDAGYRRVGNASLICLPSGQWNGLPPTCQKVSCPTLTSPGNGTFSGSCGPGATTDSECQFKCNQFFDLKGSTSLRCLADGNWSSAQPTCKLILCVTQTPPNEGAMFGYCFRAPPQNVCGFKCNQGYRLIGNANLTCLDGGNWDSQTPNCVESNETTTVETTTIGSTTIKTTSQVPTTQVSTSQVPTTQVSTSQVPTTQVPTRQASTSQTSTTNIPKCEDGKIQTGCLQLTCRDLAPPQGGSTSGACVGATPGSTCRFSCTPPNVLSGAVTLTCGADGLWSGNSPVCQVGCPAQPNIANGVVQCQGTVVGSTCTFTCGSGYSLVGPATITCQPNGVWSGNTPTCAVRQCPALQIPGGVQTRSSCANAGPGTVCTFFCPPGQLLIGPTSITCLPDSTWSGGVPSCGLAACPTRNGPLGGQLSGNCANARSGDRCTISCSAGYVLNGTATSICLPDGTWTSAPPVCTATCPTLNAPAGGDRRGTCTNAVPGNRCDFVCLGGRTLVGQTSIICNPDGTWSGAPPTCTANCPTQNAPVGGETRGTCTNAVPGNRCDFVCLGGRTLVGQTSITCNPDGTWSSAPPTCTAPAARCSDLPIPFGGSYSGTCTGAQAGSRCTFTCNPGTTLTGNTVLTCLPDGTWSSSPPTCQRVIQCPNLPSVVNGAQSGTCSNAPAGAICRYTCSAGFVQQGSGTLTCNADGTWSSSVPQCRGTPCPDVSNLANGFSNGSCANALPGDQCFFSCRLGYRLSGIPNLTCSVSGTWSANKPECLQNVCPNRIAVANATQTGNCSNAVFQNVCTYVCSAGFSLVGESIHTCLADGVWDRAAPPICTANRCQNLTAPGNGSVSGTCQGAGFGNNCLFACNTGFEPTTNATLTCQANGTWSGPSPTCRQVVCTPALLIPLNGAVSGSCIGATVNQACNFTCNQGFRLVGQPSAVCQQNGQWTSPAPTCQQIVCPDLSSPRNGRSNGVCVNAFVGSACQFSCSIGYNLNGVQELTCTATPQGQGRWSAATPTCDEEVRCPTLQAPSGGFLTGPCSFAAPRDVCTFSCNPGFTRTGAPSASCLVTGRWDQPVATCTPVVCSRLSSPDNGQASGVCSAATRFDECRFTCNRGYEVIGTRTLVCGADGQWSNAAPTCKAVSCGTLTAPVNGVLSPTCTNGVFNALCTVTCSPNYSLNGNGNLICGAEGRWEPQTPTCTRTTCPNLNPPTNGRFDGDCNPGLAGSTCTFTCSQGYSLDGLISLTCQPSGQYSGRPPICIQNTCPPIRAPANGAVTGVCSPGTPLSACTVTCNANYKRTDGGPTNYICSQTGQWDSTPAPVCTALSCPPLAAPVNGTNSGVCNPGTPSSVCTFDCLRGFRLQGQARVTCLVNEKWDASPPPTCQPITCPTLSPPLNGQQSGTCTPGQVDKLCTFTCNANYQLTGRPSILCQEDGTWVSASPTCTVITCPNLSPPTDGSMSGVCTPGNAGQTCTFTCKAGQRIRAPGTSVLTCQATGLWSGPTPVCEGITCPALAVPARAGTQGSCTAARPNEVCTFFCTDLQYRLTGVNPLICGLDGIWNSAPPNCDTRITCLPPHTAPANGVATGKCTNANPGDTCTFACNSGYSLSGSAVLTCNLDGTWSGGRPTCTQNSGGGGGGNTGVQCQDLIRIPNGRIVGGQCPKPVGSQCIFVCNPGYVINGDSVRTCQSNGRWNDVAPACIRAGTYVFPG